MTFTDILSKFDDVRREGSTGYIALCPVHDDSSPSLRVAYSPTDSKALIRCRVGCKLSDVLEAVHLSISDLFDVAPGSGDIVSTGRVEEKPSTTDLAALLTYLNSAAATDTAPAQHYAAARFGITAEKFADLGLGFDDGTVTPPSHLKLSSALYHDSPRLVVPFYDFSGVAHYLQARALPGHSPKAKWSGPVNPETASWGKYGVLKGGTGWDDVIITEGPGDGLTAAAVGYDAVLIRGAGLSTNEKLADDVAAGLKGRRVVVAGDADAAGEKFTRDVCAALSSRGIDVHRLVIPSDAGEDLTKWHENLGASFAKTFVKAVQDAAPFGADHISAEAIAQDLTRLFTDVYNARTLLSIIREQGRDVRCTPEVGYVIYEPIRGVWKQDNEEWVRRQAHKVAERVQKAILAEMSSLDSRVAAIDDKALREETGKAVDRHRAKARSGSLISYVLSSRGLDSMLRELRALDGVAGSIEMFDQHHQLLAVGNGIVNLERAELLPYDENTKSLYIMRHIDVDYVPGARNPRWERFLTEIFPDAPEMPDYLQRLIGYGITGETGEQCFAVLWGTGSNGKSVFTDTLTTIFKGITTTTAFATFESKPSGGIPNDLAALKGSRLVMTSEGEQGKPMDEAVIKRVTGQDAISARFMRKEFFEFKPTFLICMASNYKPYFKGQDEGLWRRVKLIPFSHYFPKEKRDGYLIQKFTGQRVPANAWRPDDNLGDGAEGILAWAIEGARLWTITGLADPPVITSATEQYRETSDALADFYDEYLVRDALGTIKGSEVWSLYQKWCEEAGLERREQWKRSTFFAALEERKAGRYRPNNAVAFRGIRRRRADDPHPHTSTDPDPQPERTGEDAPAHLVTEPGDDFSSLDSML